VASTMASFIIHKPKERSPFTKAAFKTVPLVIQHFYLKYVCCIIEWFWCGVATNLSMLVDLAW